MKIPFLAAILLALTALTPMASASTQTIPINKSFTFDNLTVNISGTITVDTTAKTIQGSITVTVVNNTSGETVFSKTFTFNQPFGTNGEVTSVLAVPVLPTVLAVSCFTNTSSPSTSCLVSKTPDVNFDGVINIVDLVGVARTFGTSFKATDLDGDGVVNIRDLTLVALDFGAQVLA